MSDVNLDVTGFSKPLTKLIDAVSAAVGVLYEPTRIRRKAKAEGDALVIVAQAEITKQELSSRAAKRLTIQELRRQENIEAIVDASVKFLPETVSAEPIDSDWVSRFFDACQDVSNEDLRQIWAKILASEVANPGGCSRRTLAVLRDLSPNNAEKFLLLGALTWIIKGRGVVEAVIPLNDDVVFEVALEPYGIHIVDVFELEDLGLTQFDPMLTAAIHNGDELTFHTRQHRAIIPAVLPERRIQGIRLTTSGRELLAISEAVPNFDFYERAVRRFSAYGISLEPLSQLED